MEKLIGKAAVLIEALPYIQGFRGEITVVKFGGSAMEGRERYEATLRDVVFMECVGMLPVIVHGGGKAISRKLKERGIRSEFRHGLRVTCERTIDVVRDVFNNEINPDIVATLKKFGGKAMGIHGEDVFKVSKHTAVDEATGKTVDWGFVGSNATVDVKPIKKCLAQKTIPVITPLGTGIDGNLYNVNADEAAAAVAESLKARKLVFLSDIPGILREKDDEDSRISTLRVSDVDALLKKGIIAGGMLPKVASGLKALENGVRKVHVVDGRVQHSLLLEIFTDKGVGTEIMK